MILLRLFLIIKFVFIYNLILAQENCVCKIKYDSKIHDYTFIFQNYIDECDEIEITQGDYNIYKPLIIREPIRILGVDSAKIIFQDTVGNRQIPKGIFNVKNHVDIEVKNLNAIGRNNYLITYLLEPQNNLFINGAVVNVTDNNVHGLGLIWVGPEKGFTYNRQYGSTYYQKGDIYSSMEFGEFNILNNNMEGNYSFDNSLRKKVSAIALLYCSNVVIRYNQIEKYRFGIWLYGGSAYDKSLNTFPCNEILVDEIIISANIIHDTHSSIFLSRCSDILITHNFSMNTLDVSFDLEGCLDARVECNTSINASGGSYTLLNNTSNTVVENNIAIQYEDDSDLARKRVVFIRNNNNENLYIDNYFEYVGSQTGEIRIDNRLLDDRMDRILFTANQLHNVEIVYTR